MDSNFINKLISLESKDELREITVIYEYFDDLIENEEFDRVNKLLTLLTLEKHSLRALVSTLIVTHPTREKYEYRPHLIEYTATLAVESGFSEEDAISMVRGFLG